MEIVDELVRQGFVARDRDPHDRRRFLISLTSTGAEWIEAYRHWRKDW